MNMIQKNYQEPLSKTVPLRLDTAGQTVSGEQNVSIQPGQEVEWFFD